MPEICRFFGIVISLYWRDHNPPHIHFEYGSDQCSIGILGPGCGWASFSKSDRESQ